MPITPDAVEGQVLDVLREGWAQDTHYVVNHNGVPVVIDAYQVGSALLDPGDVVTLPAPKTQG